MTNKELRTLVQDRLHVDFVRVSTRADAAAGRVVTVRRSYFYRSQGGGSVENLEQLVRDAFPGAVIVDRKDRWAPWPRDSYFEVRFQWRRSPASSRVLAPGVVLLNDDGKPLACQCPDCRAAGRTINHETEGSGTLPAYKA